MAMIDTALIDDIIDAVEARYPADIFPQPKGDPHASRDCYSAAGARLACRAIRLELAERLKHGAE